MGAHPTRSPGSAPVYPYVITDNDLYRITSHPENAAYVKISKEKFVLIIIISIKKYKLNTVQIIVDTIKVLFLTW